jgi:hypothetical protein
MNLGYFSSAYNGRRGKSGFSMVLTVVIGLILTVIALALMVTSQSEVQVASNQTRSVSALNAAEAGGTLALNEVVAGGNSVQSSGFNPADLLSYMCASNSQFVAVKQVTGGESLRQGGSTNEVTYRLVDFAAGVSTGKFLNKDGTDAPVTNPLGTKAYDPLNLSLGSQERLPDTNRAVISRANFGGNLNIVDLPGTTTQCPTTNVYPQVAGSSATYFPKNSTPGKYGLVWSTDNQKVQSVTYNNDAASPTYQTTDIVLKPTRMATIDGNDVCSAPQIRNFKLSMVEVLNSVENVPTGAFRLVYSFTIYSEGQLRSPSATAPCSGTVIGRQIVQSPNILVLNVTPPGSFAKYGTFIDRFNSDNPLGGDSVYEGRTHINTAPAFDVLNGEAAVRFTGEFTSAGCGNIGSTAAAAACGSVDIPNGKFGTISGKFNDATTTDTTKFVSFIEGGSKFAEDGQKYIKAPSTSSYQLKAALTGQTEPSSTVNGDLMKASDIQATIGIKNPGTTTPTEPANGAVIPGVYWVNPTGSNDPASSTAATKPADYDTWLAKASASTSSNPQNKTDNLLSGLYISGNVDYVNIYAATSPTATAGPDQQVIEIQQTTGSSASPSTKKFRFTITPKIGNNPGKTKVEVDTGSGYPPPADAITYDKALNGVVVVQGNIGDSTAPHCKSTSDCRGLISVPPSTPTGPPDPDTPSVQKDSGIGIYANGNIAIQDNLTYQADPIQNPTAKNALGVAAFPTYTYLNEKGDPVPVSPTKSDGTPVNGSIFWGNGLQDNARPGKAPNGTTSPSVITVQASFYAYSQGLNPSDNGVKFADYINILGGRISTVQGFNRTDKTGAAVSLKKDPRFEAGTVSPPGYPALSKTTTYQIGPVGRQSIGNVRWQLLPDPNQ